MFLGLRVALCVRVHGWILEHPKIFPLHLDNSGDAYTGLALHFFTRFRNRRAHNSR